MQSLAANGVRAERGLFSPGTTPAQPADPGRKPGDHGTERGRELAIKLLRDEYRHHAEARRRFLDEVCVGSRLQHPAIVPVYETGQCHDGSPYLAMKLVEGGPLALYDRAMGRPTDRFRELKHSVITAAWSSDGTRVLGVYHEAAGEADVSIEPHPGRDPTLHRLRRQAYIEVVEESRCSTLRGLLLTRPAPANSSWPCSRARPGKKLPHVLTMPCSFVL